MDLSYCNKLFSLKMHMAVFHQILSHMAVNFIKYSLIDLFEVLTKSCLYNLWHLFSGMSS